MLVTLKKHGVWRIMFEGTSNVDSRLLVLVSGGGEAVGGTL